MATPLSFRCSPPRRGSSRAAIALPVDEDAAIRFQDQLVTLDLHMRGNPYEQQSGGKTGGSWRLRDRAPWAVFHIQFDKHPIEPLRLRHVHRGYSCGRNIDAVR
jgi:hypothetical protein